MTPQEISDYRTRWMKNGGHRVRLHSDESYRGKRWCIEQLERQQWSMTKWTDVYEHTFFFEDVQAAQNFEMEMKPYSNQTPIALDPDERDWEYDGDGNKIYKVEAGFPTKTPINGIDK